MEYKNKTFCIEVQGDFACFTRPELKVERVSYDIITPSAARNIFSAIFWKPAFQWQVRRIEVLRPIKWFSVRRNEVSKTASPASKGIYIEDNRQQRAGMILRDVAYRLYADLCFIPVRNRPKLSLSELPETVRDREEERLLHHDENPAKYNEIFHRRASKGQYFNRPYLGCREFSCTSVRLIENLKGEPAPINEDKDFGIMLYDMDFTDPYNPMPMFYRPQMVQGVVEVPSAESEAVLR